MITGVSLLNVQRDKVNETAEALAGMEGVSEVYSVSGQWDLVVIVRVKDNETLADLVTKHMLKLDGITKSETLMAFRVYSRHDIESLFSIGQA